jgi:spore coat polysaccharide biosynthesis protein SpsF
LNKVIAIIQARMGSTRLPGKILKEVLGKPLLKYQIERIKKVKSIDQIVVATTNKEEDNQIVEFCIEQSLPYYRGSEEDVLERYFQTALQFNADIIVRLTSDCPIIDPNIIENVINYYMQNEFDYVSNTLKRTFPRGMDTEVFSFKVLKKAFIKADEPHFREHVTPYLYLNPNIFKLGSIESDFNNSQYRLTVDTTEDFNLIQKIIKELYPDNGEFSLEEVIKWLKSNPDWAELNSHIEQKKLKS